MRPRFWVRLTAVAASLSLITVTLSAQATKQAPAKTAPAKPAAAAPATQKPYEPSVGQPGKDVVWVPTSQALVDKMLDMTKVTAADYVMDLGSGDGRTVIT